MRAVLGIIVGLLAGFFTIILIGIVGVGATYSVPPGLNVYNSRAVVDAVLNMPPAPKIALLVALFGGALAGTALAKRIARRAWAAWTVAGLIAIYVVLSVLSLPLPGWMQALSIAAPLLGGLIGNHLVSGGAPVADTTPEI